MEEELLGKYYEEYKEKCFELMFQVIPSTKLEEYMSQNKIPKETQDYSREPFYDGYSKCTYINHDNTRFIMGNIRLDKHIVFIDKSGQTRLECNHYKVYGLFNEGYILVLNDKYQWNFIDIEGNLLLQSWQNQPKNDFCFFYFEKGFAQIPGTNSKYTSKKGEIVSKDIVDQHYEQIKGLQEDYEPAFVKKDGYYYIVYNFVECNIEKSSIKRSMIGYTLKDQNIKFKYKPIYNFSNHVICESNTDYYLYDKINNKYCKLGSKYEITFYNNMIINKKTKEVFYIDSDKNELINISSIYWEKLIGLGTDELKYTYAHIISYSDFKDTCKNDDNIMTLIENEIKQIKIEQQKEEDRRREEELKAQVILNQQEQLIKEKESLETLNKSLSNMREALNIINNLKKNNVKRFFITKEELLVKVEDHYEIKEEYKKALKIFDLSTINFTNTKMSNIDFSYCNLNSLDPQTIYKKDMSNSNFTGATFSADSNFKDINIENTSFDDDQTEISPRFIDFEGSIYNEHTIFPKWYRQKTMVKQL